MKYIKQILFTILVLGIGWISYQLKAEVSTVSPILFFDTFLKFDTMDEVWKKIKGFEDCYQISNFGNVKRLSKEVPCKGGFRNPPEHVMAKKYDKNGYVCYCLSKDDKTTYIKAHRTVLETFSTNPDCLPVVNHKNGIKDDNRLNNLEWCTHSDNNKHRYRVLGHSPVIPKKIDRKDRYNIKTVIQYDLNGNQIAEFISVMDAAESVGAKGGSGISHVCRGVKPTYKGFIWKYKENL